MSNPKISIIVPIYKVEEFLNQCLDSITNQTYNNLEIILVDNGSPDNCPAICDEYAAKDNRIIVIHQQNGGVSAARNAGLDAASGEYIGFIDGDDWIAADMFEKLLNTITLHNSDVAVCQFSKYYTPENTLVVPINWESDTIEGENLIGSIVFSAKNRHRAELGPCVWNKLFKKSCFENIRFDTSMKIGEDFWVWLQIASKNIKCSLCHESLYFYRQRATGAIASTNYLEHSRLGYKTAKMIVGYFKDDKQLKNIALENLTVRFFIYVNYLARAKDNTTYYGIKKDYLGYLAEIKNDYKTYSSKYKYGIILLRYAPTVLWLMSIVRMRKWK